MSENIRRASFYLLLAALFLALMSAFAKYISSDLTVVQVVFARTSISLLVLLPYLIWKREKLGTSFFLDHAIRAGAGFLNMFCFFYSLKFISLVDGVLLNNTMPLFVPLIAWLWKKSRISLMLIPGLLCGFLGVALVLHPGKDIFHTASLFALASGLFMAISMVGVYSLAKIETPSRILFYYFLLSTLIALILLPFFWQTPVDKNVWWGIVAMGLSAAFFQIFLTLGFQNAPVEKVSPLIYVALILSGFIDWFYYSERPDLLSIVGIVCIIIGAIYCIKTKSPT